MNNDRRKDIRRAIALITILEAAIEEAKGIIEDAKDGEEEYRDNMPESLHQSEKYERADAAVSKLEEVCEAFDQFDISELTSSLEEACE